MNLIANPNANKKFEVCITIFPKLKLNLWNSFIGNFSKKNLKERDYKMYMSLQKLKNFITYQIWTNENLKNTYVDIVRSFWKLFILVSDSKISVLSSKLSDCIATKTFWVLFTSNLAYLKLAQLRVFWELRRKKCESLCFLI